jgi:hypothetical protein
MNIPNHLYAVYRITDTGIITEAIYETANEAKTAIKRLKTAKPYYDYIIVPYSMLLGGTYYG